MKTPNHSGFHFSKRGRRWQWWQSNLWEEANVSERLTYCRVAVRSTAV